MSRLAARCGAAELEEAQMALRNIRASGELELRVALALPPPAQAGCKIALLRHEYLPRIPVK
nr:hypothetical protein [Bradyrhizobium erythrophlei]